MTKYYPHPHHEGLPDMEVSRDGKYRLTPETVKVIDQCPYCNRDASDSENYVRLHGIVYRQCGMNEGHNAEEPATWPAYLGGALMYDIPLLFLGLVVILGIEYFVGPHYDRVLMQYAYIARVVTYAFFSLVPAAAAWWGGLPVMIAPVSLSLMSYTIILRTM